MQIIDRATNGWIQEARLAVSTAIYEVGLERLADVDASRPVQGK